MATSKSFADFVVEQLSAVEGIRLRAMMGEYVLYCRDKVVGGLYDDRLMVKPTSGARALLPDASEASPYPGAKAMLEVDCLEDREKLGALMAALYADLPAPKKKK